jgi:hypothetical protein
MTDASDRTIREVLNRYDEAFNAHDPGLRADPISDDRVIEDWA